jgi:hypothetical protein
LFSCLSRQICIWYDKKSRVDTVAFAQNLSKENKSASLRNNNYSEKFKVCLTEAIQDSVIFFAFDEAKAFLLGY